MCQKYLSPFEGGGPALKPLVRGLTCFHDGFPRTLFLLLRSHRWQLLFSFHPTFYLVGGKVAITVFSPLMPFWKPRWSRLWFRKPTNRVRTDWTLWRESRLLSLYKGSPRPSGTVLAGMLFNSRLACFVCVDHMQRFPSVQNGRKIWTIIVEWLHCVLFYFIVLTSYFVTEIKDL